MIEILPWASLALLVVVAALQLLLLRRRDVVDLAPLEQSQRALLEACERLERTLRDDVARSRQEVATLLGQAREEQARSQHAATGSLVASVGELARVQQAQLGGFGERLEKLTRSNEEKIEGLRRAVEERLRAIQQDNAQQLEQVRATVDEKLQGTLEKRLGESFRQVSERLEEVSKGLGEMRSLATGVGDLKKVLTNVKTRGTWGEVQLGAMLEQVLSPEQYATNVATRRSGERVEFAIRLPGRGGGDGDVVWLPIDSKFPVEDWQRLVEAQERGDAAAADEAGRALETRVKACARDISTKYVEPPGTTDFAILFLPTEGLFAEVLRRTGLVDQVQREHRVVIAGPTTLWAILSSLQMGFRTLAIEKRSSEVWNLLGAVKTEWTKYGAVLEKVQKKLGEASTTIEAAQRRTRVIGSKLRGVEELPLVEAGAALGLDAAEAAVDLESVADADEDPAAVAD